MRGDGPNPAIPAVFPLDQCPACARVEAGRFLFGHFWDSILENMKIYRLVEPDPDGIVEVWRAIPGWPYEVSTDGNVRPMGSERNLRPYPNGGRKRPSPYRVTLYRKGGWQRKKEYVHLLVAVVQVLAGKLITLIGMSPTTASTMCAGSPRPRILHVVDGQAEGPIICPTHPTETARNAVEDCCMEATFSPLPMQGGHVFGYQSLSEFLGQFFKAPDSFGILSAALIEISTQRYTQAGGGSPVPATVITDLVGFVSFTSFGAVHY